jgi:hypothetical protein
VKELEAQVLRAYAGLDGFRDRAEKAEAELAAERKHHDDVHGAFQPDSYKELLLKRAAGRDSGERQMGSHSSGDSFPVNAAAKSAAHFQKALREAIEREAHDA